MSQTFVPASLYLIRGDATYYKAGWGGSHEFATGFFLEPNNVYDQQTVYINGGFCREYQTTIANNPALGTRPYRRDYADPISLQTRSARDSNYAFYLQDSWRPDARLTANIGLRFDYVRRIDQVKNITRQDSWTVQPRLGATYLLTQDAKNVLRASYARMGEQVMGRDGVTTFGADDTVNFRREYDNNLNGVFGEAGEIQLAPATSTAVAAQQIAPGLHQPYHRRVHRRVPRSSSDGRWVWTSATSTAPTRTPGRASTSTASIRTARACRSAASAGSIRTRASSTSRRTTPGAS